MSEIADNTLCEKFEANVFAKSRCQNCFRVVGAHQRGNQAAEDHKVNTSGCGNGTNNKSSSDAQWDPLCILVPQCELYVCVDSKEKTESCQESLEYTQLSSRSDQESKEESEEIAAYPDSSTGASADADTDATLGREWEMTRFFDSILGSDKQNTMYYAGKKQEVRPENLHADRPRWSESTASKSSGKTERWSCLKAESKVMSQDHADKWRKSQAEGGYFSLERRKSEPSCMSSPPRVGRSPLPVHCDASRVGGYPASSISSADSSLSCRPSSKSEGQHGLMRQEYTVLADLPKPKRISHKEAFEKERSSSRTRSPGRAEVERIFGHERRKSETLEAFQALEEGLLDRLDSKTLKLAKEGQLVRRKSNPTLHKEASKRLPREPEQPKRSRGESVCMGKLERSSGSPSGSSRSGSPTQRLERENRGKGVSLHSTGPPQQVRGERRQWEKPSLLPKGSREKAPLHVGTHGKHMDISRKRCLETGHQHASSGKTTDSKWKNCLGALHIPSPTQSLDKSQGSYRGQMERYKESDRRARGKPLLPVDTAEQQRKDVTDCREAVLTLSPGRGMAAPGKDKPTLSPRRQVGSSWVGQGETSRLFSPGISTGTNLKSHGEAGSRVIPDRCTRGNQRETRHSPRNSLSPERSMGTSFKSHGETGHSASLHRSIGGSQKETTRSVSPERSRGTSFKSHGEAGCSLSSQRSTGGSQKETMRSVSPERSRGTSFKSHGETGHSASPPRYTGGSQKETTRSLSPERSIGTSFRSHGEAGCSLSPHRYTGGSQKETTRSRSPERSMGTSFQSHGEVGHSVNPQRYTGDNQRETRHSISPERSTGTSFKSHEETGHSACPHRYTGGSQKGTTRSLSPERSRETSFQSHGEVGHSVNPQRYTGDNQRETRRSISPERSRGTSFKSHEETGRSASPPRYSGGSQKETTRSLSPERSIGTSFRSHGEAGCSLSPHRYTGGSQKETTRSRSPERSMGTSFQSHGEVGRSVNPQRYTGDNQRETRRSISPERSTGTNFKSHREIGHSACPHRYAGGSQKETTRSRSPERSRETSFQSHGEVGRSVNPQRYTEDNQRETRRSISPERYTGTSFKSHEETGRSTSPHRYTGGSHKETMRSLSPERSRETSFQSHGEVGRSLNPQRYTEDNQRETRRSISPERYTGTGFRSHGGVGHVLSPQRYTGGSQRESGEIHNLERSSENRNISEEARHSPSPGRPVESSCSSPKQLRCCGDSQQYPENSWKNQKEAFAGKPVVSADSDWSSKEQQSTSYTSKKQNDWDSCGKSSYRTSPPANEEMNTDQGDPCPSMNPFWTPENNQRSLEGPLCPMHTMQLVEQECISSRGHLHFTKPGQRQLETNRKNQESSTEWMANERMHQEKCQSLMKSEKKVENDGRKEEKFLQQPQLDRGPPVKTACTSESPDLNLNANQKHQPDLLNFKKGWMSILDEPGEWKKHWFVLTDSSLKYYRDSNAEEADDLDGEIDLRYCTDVTEFAVQRNYGFQIHTKDGVFTLSAMTSGIRRNWIEALRKNIRPASVPDVTKLSDCNKENSFGSYGSQKSSFRPEEQRPGTASEVIPRGTSRKADGQRRAFDYVELSPLQHGLLNQGSPQRTRGSTRASEGKCEELERDLALRSEERRKWFESPASGILQTDGLARNASHKADDQESPGSPLSDTQRSRLSEEIEKKWQELEGLPLKESKRVPLMALLTQSKESHEDISEALEKEVQALKSQLESLSAQSEARSHADRHTPRGYISQDACERSLAEMEASHRQVMMELQRHHQREMERLHLEKERLLAEEAAATAAAIEALKKAHREELNRELGRTRSFQKGGLDSDALRRQHESDVESLKRELQVLSEQYSHKCLEIGGLVAKAEEQEQILQSCQQEGKELLRHNQELQRRLSEEIGQLRAFIAAQNSRDGASHNNERNVCELEVLLRVKENELQYLKKEVQCLKDELQMMQKDKRFASGKYQDVYVELNYIKRRSEREIEQLKEHLRLAMAALQEKQTLHNSIGK
ncbi:TRIO and F-actin-binding protein isoform X2 [Sphaerodactylus townsendi]|uniref:TRIO and F-actin-binding protein isoform X2 n=1 Tax=Sphaerodactylus townsendi TaxID=933632 RepID=UPI002026BA73|nr:TRIO and F-actin-binding protein isoform X2 [Sphaerodactylus townsendi]